MTDNFDNFVNLFLETPSDIFPMPERLYQNKIGRKGGTYFDKDKNDITDNIYAGGTIDSNFPGMFAKMDTSDVLSELPKTSKGKNIIRTNLYRRVKDNMVLWKWKKEPDTVVNLKSDKIVSVEIGSKHFYCLKVEFQTPIKLASYPLKKSEPKLRPTGRGNLKFGRIVGEITTSQKITHPVYDVITIV